MPVFLNKKIIIIFLIFLAIGGYFYFKKVRNKNEIARYILAQVEKGAIISSVSGSGQILASEQIDVKSKVNSEVLGIYVTKGKEVKKGSLIIRLDDRDFKKAVEDAENALEMAKLELEELLNPPDELDILKAKNALLQAKESLETTKENLKKSYEDGFNNVVNIFLDLPSIMTGLRDILFSYNFSRIQTNIDYYTDRAKIFDNQAIVYQKDAYETYQIIKKLYERNLENYKTKSIFSPASEIESLISETYETTKNLAEALKSAINLIQFYQDKLNDNNLIPESLSNNHLTSLTAFLNKTNNYISLLFSIQKTIKSYRDAILNAERTIEEKELALKSLTKEPDELTLKNKKLTIQQKENALNNAKENLANCSIYAPLDGVISEIKVKKGDSVTGGTILATIISKEKIAEISLTEIDAAKVKVGQKATLTFDAIPDLILTGKVIEVDTVGMISQGVVSYTAKISLDSDDTRIKPSMSVTAEIVVEAKTDVLVLPLSAIKTQGNLKYVELIEAPEELKNQLKIGSQTVLPKTLQIKNQNVEIGTSNDTQVEIVSGLKEGDVVISSKVSSQSQTTQNRTTSGQFRFQIPGMGGSPPR